MVASSVFVDAPLYRWFYPTIRLCMVMAIITIAGERAEVPSGTTIESAVSSLGLHPDSYLFLMGGVPVPMDTVIQDDSEVRAVRVASGG